MPEMSPVDQAVAVLVQQIRHLKLRGETGLLNAEERDFLAMATRELREIEHGRASLVVAVIAGRRPVEGVPAAVMDRLLNALEGVARDDE